MVLPLAPGERLHLLGKREILLTGGEGREKKPKKGSGQEGEGEKTRLSIVGNFRRRARRKRTLLDLAGPGKKEQWGKKGGN